MKRIWIVEWSFKGMNSWNLEEKHFSREESATARAGRLLQRGFDVNVVPYVREEPSR